MNRKAIKLLILLTLTVVFVLAPATLFGGREQSQTSSLTSPGNRAAKRTLARKDAALGVLREYLPQYADILEAGDVHHEDLFYRGSSVVPISSPFDPSSPFINPIRRLELLQSIEEWLGTRYRYGGTSRAGVDCSGFVYRMVDEILGRRLARSSSAQARAFAPIISVDSLQFGDLMFFTGTRRNSKRIGHVGIYLGNGVFAHSSTSKGVTFNHITDGYYTRRFRWGGRFTELPAGDADRNGVYASP
jgi:hypothetical protein